MNIWELIGDNYNYLAKDKDGSWYAYSSEPVLQCDGWSTADNDAFCTALVDIIDEDELDPFEDELGCYWEYSLLARGPTWNLDHVLTL